MASKSDIISREPTMHKVHEEHDYVQSKPPDSRSPCPALNTLANHGYVPRDGKDIKFFALVDALVFVYNISWFLAFTLTLAAFLTSGKLKYRNRSKPSDSKMPLLRWRVDLGSLSTRGSTHIAHDASFVHPNFVESHSPDQDLVDKLLTFASTRGAHCGGHRGLSLADIACYHAQRENELPHPLDNFHKQVALGECGLSWAVMRKRLPVEKLVGMDAEHEEVIPEDVLKTWFGSERLPEDWWAEGGSRPVQPVGLLEARHRANDVAKLIAKQPRL